MTAEIVIGIDLGSTKCCVAGVCNNEVIVVMNMYDDLHKTTPCYVRVDQDGSTIVGKFAKEGAYRYLDSTVYDLRKLIGREFDDPVLQQDMEHWPFKVVNGDGLPKIEIREKKYHPEEILAKLISEIKNITEEYFRLDRGTICKAVVTVPVYFDVGQRQATVNACSLAGLKLVWILNEPTAAAIAYFDKNLERKAKNVLIFDLGGRTLDVTVIEINADTTKVLGSQRDTHLGGEDFTKTILDYCFKKFKENTGIDLMDMQNSHMRVQRAEAIRISRRVLLACERTKRNLSKAPKSEVFVHELYFNHHLEVAIYRRTFEEMNGFHFNRCIEVVQQALANSAISKDQVDDIVLIGGSTRMPKIRSLLEVHFHPTKLKMSIDPVETVAYGAAVHAANLTGNNGLTQILKEVQDVTLMSVRVETADKMFSLIIPENTKLPIRKCRKAYAEIKNHDEALIHVFYGEEVAGVQNKLFGPFRFKFPPVPRGGPLCYIVLEMNRSGILQITAISAIDYTKKHEISLKLGDAFSNRSTSEVTDMVLTTEPLQVEVVRPAHAMRFPDDVYKLPKTRKGYALVLNITKFTDRSKLRIGAHHDTKYMRKLWTDLGYQVICAEGQIDKMEAQLIIGKFVAMFSDGVAQSSVVFVGSHGINNRILTSDGGLLHLYKDIVYQFTTKKCPKLDGKPKLFFVQACQSFSSDSSPSQHAPVINNTLVSFSVIPGHLSYRDHYMGTYYTYCLAKVFMKEAWRTDLLKMLEKVQDEMCTIATESEETQLSTYSNIGLKQNLYFNL